MLSSPAMTGQLNSHKIYNQALTPKPKNRYFIVISSVATAGMLCCFAIYGCNQIHTARSYREKVKIPLEMPLALTTYGDHQASEDFQPIPPTPGRTGLVDELSNEAVVLRNISSGSLVGITEASRDLVLIASVDAGGQVKINQFRKTKPTNRNETENIAMIIRSYSAYNLTSFESPPDRPDRSMSSALQSLHSLDLVEQVANQLQWGSIAFDTPRKLTLGEPVVIELLLSPTKSLQELESMLKSPERTEKARIKISNRMEAMLKGQGFKIEALIPQEQAVSKGKTTRWKWEATPTEDGDKILHLSISAIIKVSNEDAPLVIQTYNKRIRVETSVSQRISKFLSGNWQWLWASILVPLLPFLWRWSQQNGIWGNNKPPRNT